MSESQQGQASKDCSQFSVDLKTNKIKKRTRRRKLKKNHNKITSSSYRKERCLHYNKGSCTKGDMCTFSHDFDPQSSKKICKYFLSNACTKGELCKYSHCTKQYPCRFYHLQNKCNQADGCRFSHQPVPSDVLTQFLKQNKQILVQMWKDNNIHLISDRDLRNAIQSYVKSQPLKNQNNQKLFQANYLPELSMQKIQNLQSRHSIINQLHKPKIDIDKSRFQIDKIKLQLQKIKTQPERIKLQPERIKPQYERIKLQPERIKPQTQKTKAQQQQNPPVHTHKHVKQDLDYVPQKIKFDPRQRIKPMLRNVKKPSIVQQKQKQIEAPLLHIAPGNNKYSSSRSWLIDVTDRQQTIGDQNGLGYFTKQSLQRFLYSYY